MLEGSQLDNNPTIPGGMKPISEEALQKVETPHITNVTEGTGEVQGLHDRNKRAMEKALFEQEEFHKAKTRRKVIFTAIASFAAATVLALGGVSLLNKLSSNSPSQALLDSSKQLNGLETVVAGLKATGTKLSADNANAISSNNTISSTLGVCQLNLKDTISELNQRKANDNIIYTTATSVFNQNITLTERLNVISNTVLSPSEIISRIAESLVSRDPETIQWLAEVGCVVPPTETATATSTTMFYPTDTATSTGTALPTNTSTPSATPGFTPDNPTSTPIKTNTPDIPKTPTKSNPPTQIPPVTPTPERTRTPLPPTATEMPTVVPTSTKASFPTQIPGTTRTAVPNVN